VEQFLNSTDAMGVLVVADRRAGPLQRLDDILGTMAESGIEHRRIARIEIDHIPIDRFM